MDNNKVVAIVLGGFAALFGLSLLARFVLLSQYGVSGGWMYFGLPIGGIGLVVLLLRLGLLNFGERSGTTPQPWHYNGGVQTPPRAASAPQRLQELDNMRATGAISDAEYTADHRRHLNGDESGTQPRRIPCHQLAIHAAARRLPSPQSTRMAASGAVVCSGPSTMTNVSVSSGDWNPRPRRK